ncbi:hypothetical protein [Streptomyces sp. RKAG293]|uniref:hypothetical protein n=1 Tax=Streptomyces sp. RKAG293 TaxID=2893403 RepID=UPI0020345431|nr:hypothetical protein [Streptomyces sp. RKAG293]MCM2423749.1 hypothetical protein [Streptomyces sp. RKAG293]
MDLILLTVDGLLGVLASALALSGEIVRARQRTAADLRPNRPQGHVQLPSACACDCAGRDQYGQQRTNTAARDVSHMHWTST